MPSLSTRATSEGGGVLHASVSPFELFDVHGNGDFEGRLRELVFSIIVSSHKYPTWARHPKDRNKIHPDVSVLFEFNMGAKLYVFVITRENII